MLCGSHCDGMTFLQNFVSSLKVVILFSNVTELDTNIYIIYIYKYLKIVSLCSFAIHTSICRSYWGAEWLLFKKLQSQQEICHHWFIFINIFFHQTEYKKA